MAPCLFAAAPASAAAICRATAPSAPAAADIAAKDGESTGARCPAHNLSSSLSPSSPVSLSAHTATAGADADSQSESGGGDAPQLLVRLLLLLL